MSAKRGPYWTPYEFYCRPLRKESNQDLLQSILESEDKPLDLKQTKLALRILDWQDFRRVTLGELPRLEKIRLACRNNDGRILRSLKPTLEEILESMGVEKSALAENEAMRERFLDIVLNNPKHNDNQTWYFAFLWYDNFESDKFRTTAHEMCAIPCLNGDHILYTPFYYCFYELGLTADAISNNFLPILVRRFVNQLQGRFIGWVYRPEYIRYFVPKYLKITNVNRERLKNALVDCVRGDEAMTSWVNEL